MRLETPAWTESLSAITDMSIGRKMGPQTLELTAASLGSSVATPYDQPRPKNAGISLWGKLKSQDVRKNGN